MRRFRFPALWIIGLSFVIAGCASRPLPPTPEISKTQKEREADTVQARQDLPTTKVLETKPEERAKVETLASPPPLSSEPQSGLAKRDARGIGAVAPMGAERGLLAPQMNLDQLWLPSEPTDRENYAHFDNNPVHRVAEQPVSTFSIDVDTGSYANVRRFLRSGALPVRDAVRVEELVNYFSYDYPTPDSAATPFRVTTEIGPTPWNPETLLLHIGIKGYEPPHEELPPANLVFLIDVSGSMASPDKLELVKSSLLLLSRQLHAHDRLSIVVYAGDSGVVLEPTQGDQSAKIQAAIQSLHAGGSTNGGSGIRLAYAMAEQAFIKDGVNRVLLATDGDFNVGTVSFEALKDLIVEKRKSGIALTTLGVGT